MPGILLALLSAALPRGESLDSEIRSIAATAGGTVGVSIVHVESGRRVAIRGADRFPMASVFKLPVAFAILHRVDEGALRLDRRVRFSPADLSPGYSPLAGGHLAIVVLVRASDRTLAEREQAIAQIARAAFDRWPR